MYDVHKIRQDFPIFNVKINGKPNIFLDTAASAQKPQSVIDTFAEVYGGTYTNNQEKPSESLLMLLPPMKLFILAMQQKP